MVNKLILWLTLASLMSCATKKVIVVTHKKQYKLYKEIAQVKKLDSIPKDYREPTDMYGYTIGQTTDDSCITKLEYPQVFGLVSTQVQDSINARLKQAFLQSIDQSKALSDSLSNFGAYYSMVDYVVDKQSRQQLRLTQIILEGLRSARNFRAIHWKINLKTGKIQTRPTLRLDEIFEKDAYQALYGVIIKHFNFEPYLQAYQKGELLVHTHNLHVILNQEQGVFFFTGAGLIGFQRVVVPKSEIKHLLKKHRQH